MQSRIRTCSPLRRAMTMIETLVVVMIASIVLGGLMMLFSRSFFGSRKGVDTLSVLQEQSKLVAWLKHDLRTMIMGNSIAGPLITDDSTGTAKFEFYKVETADSFGRPIPVKITYRRTGGSTTAKTLAGVEKAAYTVERTDGTSTKIFMNAMISDFHLSLLDRAGNSALAQPLTTRKVRVELEGFSSDLLRTTISIYSPYISREASQAAATWMPNFHQQSYAPGTGIVTYNGALIDSSDLTRIGPAVSLNRERRF